MSGLLQIVGQLSYRPVFIRRQQLQSPRVLKKDVNVKTDAMFPEIAGPVSPPRVRAIESGNSSNAGNTSSSNRFHGGRISKPPGPSRVKSPVHQDNPNPGQRQRRESPGALPPEPIRTGRGIRWRVGRPLNTNAAGNRRRPPGCFRGSRARRPRRRCRGISAR